jgi:hypothetical protein
MAVTYQQLPFMTKRLALVGLLITLGGCLSPPQPFAPDAVSPLAQLPGITAVRVDLKALGGGSRLEYALSDALGAHDLPAYFDNDGPQSAYRLSLSPSAKGVEVAINDAKGTPVKQFSADFNPQAMGPALAKSADHLAAQIAQILIPADPSLALLPQARVSVLPGQGATGDGDDALAEALTQALRGRVPLDKAPSLQNYVLTARVAVKHLGAKDSVAIVWLVLDAQGREAARITQANQVPQGALDKAWGRMAQDAAQAAADALIPVLRDLPPVPPP